MPFNLPAYSKLDTKQQRIVNWSFDKNLIVRGPPGTGKTVLAVYRLNKIYLENPHSEVLFLVYNKPLKDFILSATVHSGVHDLNFDKSCIKTWNSWINEFYRNNFRKSVCGSDFVYDWDEIKVRFKTLGIVYDHIIIDETQDFPPELIESLKFITHTLTCFMDENQTIEEEFTTINELERILRYPEKMVLNVNYRNVREITDFANLFNKEVQYNQFTNHKLPEIRHCSGGYGHDSPNEFGWQIKKIVEEECYDLDTFAVLVNPSALNNTYKELREIITDKDVFLYKTQTSYNSLDFMCPGVYVLSFGTMKGLEFDAVILPKCESIKKNASDDIDRNRFYVAITRARYLLFCLYTNDSSTYSNFNVFKHIKRNEVRVKWSESSL